MSSRFSRSPVSLKSSRSSSVSKRSSSASPSRSKSNSPMYILSDKIMWTYMIIAVVVFAVVLMVVGTNYVEVHSWARISSWLDNTLAIALILFAVFALAAYAAYAGHRAHGGCNAWAGAVGGSFLAVAGLMVLYAYLVYRSHSFTAAFYVAVIALVFAVIKTFAVWKAHALASLGTLPLVIVVAVAAYLAWFMADETTECSSSCSKEFKVDTV